MMAGKGAWRGKSNPIWVFQRVLVNMMGGTNFNLPYLLHSCSFAAIGDH